MRNSKSHLVEWTQAERAAISAEVRVCEKYCSMSSRAPSDDEVAKALALRARASRLLHVFLEEMRSGCDANRCDGWP